MAGCQRGLSLSKLATHGYNNVITTHNKCITRKKRKYVQLQSAAGQKYITISRKKKEYNMI